jgi:putative protease
LITGPSTGIIEATVTEIRVNQLPVDKALKGEEFSIPLAEKIRPSDTLYKIIKTGK